MIINKIKNIYNQLSSIFLMKLKTLNFRTEPQETPGGASICLIWTL